MIDIADLRLTVVISVLASTGMRIGALPPLKLSHLEKKGDVYKFKIYENTRDESICFCSPECANYIDSYLEFRARSGEHLDREQSYLIREQFDINDIEQIRKQGRSIARDSIANMLYLLAIKAGLRKVNHQFTGREQVVPLAHGFRKFFTTQLINSKVNPEIREMLLGHSIGLASAYCKPTEDEMLDEYMKARDNLTINEENRLKRRVEKLEVEASQLQRLQAAVRALEQKIK